MPQAAEFVDRTTVAVCGEDIAVERRALRVVVTAFARVQTNAQLAECIDTEAHCAWRIARLVVEHEALAPLLRVVRVGSAAAVVCVTEEVARKNTGLAVLQKTFGVALLSDQQTTKARNERGGAIDTLHRIHPHAVIKCF